MFGVLVEIEMIITAGGGLLSTRKEQIREIGIKNSMQSRWANTRPLIVHRDAIHANDRHVCFTGG